MRGVGATLPVLLVACIGTTPEEERRAEQGRYDDGDEEHRPGQPCLACHSRDYSPGDAVFAVAGTVYAMATDDDEDGLEGAEVAITDAEGRELVATTNRAGNFMVEVSNGGEEQRSDGRLRIGFEPEFPLEVRVRFGASETEMESLIWRDGSCASCHRGSEPRVDGVEKVFVFEDSQ